MPGRPPLGRPVALALLRLAPVAPVPLVALVALAGACSGPARPATSAVPVQPAQASPSAATVRTCGALVAALPDELDPGVHRRPVTPVAGSTAAWGDPAIVLRCGVPAGRPTDAPFAVDGVQWAVATTSRGQRWSTVGRAVEVSVDVPGSYDRQAELVISLSPAIVAHLGGRSPEV